MMKQKDFKKDLKGRNYRPDNNETRDNKIG